MEISQGTITLAKRMGRKELADSALPGEPLTQVDKVVDTLAGATSPAAEPGARILLRRMEVGEWKVIRGVHRSKDDPSPHVLVEVAGVRFHLRLDAKMCIFDITYRTGDGQTIRLSGHDPCVSPGT